MSISTLRGVGALSCALVAYFFGSLPAAKAQETGELIAAAIDNITVLVRAGRIGYATFWDGNKYVQCRRKGQRELHCEAAGFSMQPSLRHVLTPERLDRLTTLGWSLDPSFGNYVRTFPADMATTQAANHILQTLTDVYSTNISELEISTTWVRDTPCPPRNGPSQNLAGIAREPTGSRMIVIFDCAYTPDILLGQPLQSTQAVISEYGALVAAEIQRLRINHKRRVYAVLSAVIGYVQCMPQSASLALFCEAQSAESWPTLAKQLTPERVARLHSAGYAHPGRGPNYSKTYPLASLSDTAIAQEILTILHEVYGYTGSTKLGVITELRY